MTTFTARLELDTRADDFDVLVDARADYSAAAAHTRQGRVEVAITVPAGKLRQAITTAMAVAGFDVYALEVLPTDEFDRRLGLDREPDPLSVEEAGPELGVSAQRVRQRLNNPTLDGRRVGGVSVVPASALQSGKLTVLLTGGTP